jgi:hypothetical protein
MRESRTYGFVRGAHSDMRPYRDPHNGRLKPSALTYLRFVSSGKQTSGPLCRRKWPDKQSAGQKNTSVTVSC